MTTLTCTGFQGVTLKISPKEGPNSPRLQEPIAAEFQAINELWPYLYTVEEAFQ